MGRELSEGRLGQLERSLVLAREQLEEMRRVYSGDSALSFCLSWLCASRC